MESVKPVVLFCALGSFCGLGWFGRFLRCGAAGSVCLASDCHWAASDGTFVGAFSCLDQIGKRPKNARSIHNLHLLVDVDVPSGRWTKNKSPGKSSFLRFSWKWIGETGTLHMHGMQFGSISCDQGCSSVTSSSWTTVSSSRATSSPLQLFSPGSSLLSSFAPGGK